MTQEEFLIATRKRVAKLLEQQVVTALPSFNLNRTTNVDLPSISANELAELIKAVAILEDAQANSNLYKGSKVDDEETDDDW
jgi:hypothetical protein